MKHLAQIKEEARAQYERLAEEFTFEDLDTLITTAYEEGERNAREAVAVELEREKEGCCAYCSTPASGAPDETVFECMDLKCKHCHETEFNAGITKAQQILRKGINEGNTTH